MRPKRRVEEQVVVQQAVHALVHPHVKEQRTRRHGPALPVSRVIPLPFCRQQLLFDVVVIRCRYDDFRVPVHPCGEGDPGRSTIDLPDFANYLAVVECHSVAFGHPHHGLDDFVHPAHRVPSAQTAVCIIHQAVQGRRLFRLRAEEEHRELHHLEELRVLEVFPGMFGERGEEGELRGVPQGRPLGKLHHAVGCALHERPHADLVFLLRFGHERFEPGPSPWLDGLEQSLLGLEISGDVDGAVVEEDLVTRIQPPQIQLLLHFRPVAVEKTFEDVRHPIPARPHVKPEAIRLEDPRAAARLVVLLQHMDLKAAVSQRSGGCNARKTSPDDKGLTRSGRRIGMRCHVRGTRCGF